MKKTILPFSVKEFLKKYSETGYIEIADYLIQFRMDYWQYVVLKNELIKLYGRQCSDNHIYSFVRIACDESRKIELEYFQKRIEDEIQSHTSLREKINYLNIELQKAKDEWTKLVPKFFTALNITKSHIPIAVDGTQEEPVYFYILAWDYLSVKIKNYENDDLIERTPIVFDLRSSLLNFSFTDWTKKAETEAPQNIREKLDYYISIRSDIQRWEDDNQKGKKSNFFEVRRFTSYDQTLKTNEKISNLLRYINWCDCQIGLIEKKLQQGNIVPAQSDIITSFQYIHLQKNQSNLTNLLDSLKKSGFVDKNTGLGSFRKIFSGSDNFNPIIWTGNKSELAYFIKLIHNEKKKVKSTKKEIWNTTIKCFIKPDRSPFASDELRNSKTPAAAEQIRTIVSNL